MTKKINIAIDGPSGAGKSTIAKTIANKFNYLFINTGSLYRAIAYYLNSQKINLYNEGLVCSKWSNNKLDLKISGEILIEGVNVTPFLRDDSISQKSSIIAKYSKIRSDINEILKNFQTLNKGVIMEGRDTTYNIMPNAELKIFLWADSKTRAMRRVKQNEELSLETNFETVWKELEKRDYNDTHRKLDPLQKTEDSIFIDSTHLNFDQVVEQISKLINAKLS